MPCRNMQVRGEGNWVTDDMAKQCGVQQIIVWIRMFLNLRLNRKWCKSLDHFLSNIDLYPSVHDQKAEEVCLKSGT